MSYLTDAYFADRYTPLSPIQEHEQVQLVRDEDRSCFMLRKKYPLSQLPLLRILQQAQPEHIPAIREVHCQGNCCYLYEDFFSMPTLQQQLNDGITFSPDELLSFMRSLCCTVAQLHQLGILHLDIKSANILYQPGQEPLLLDFSISALSGTPAAAASQGTRGCAAPEQYDKRMADERTDIFGLGILFYALLSATPDLPPAILHRLLKISKRCTQIQPADRYPSCEQLEHALKRVDFALCQKIYLPGLRSAKAWKRCLSACLYVAFLIFWIMSFFAVHGSLRFTVLILFLWSIGQFSIFFDKLNPLYRLSPPSLKKQYRLLLFLIFSIGWSITCLSLYTIGIAILTLG